MKEQLGMSIPQAAKALGISRHFAYQLAKKGELPTVKLGTRRLVVPRQAIEKMLQKATGGGRGQLKDLKEGP